MSLPVPVRARYEISSIRSNPNRICFLLITVLPSNLNILVLVHNIDVCNSLHYGIVLTVQRIHVMQWQSIHYPMTALTITYTVWILYSSDKELYCFHAAEYIDYVWYHRKIQMYSVVQYSRNTFITCAL